MTEEQRRIVRAQIEEAHKRGIMVRYWDTPGWPISVRNGVWGVLVQEGVDLLNVDDLKVCALFLSFFPGEWLIGDRRHPI